MYFFEFRFPPTAPKHFVPPPPNFSQLLVSQKTANGIQGKIVSPKPSQRKTVAKVQPQKSIAFDLPSSWQEFSNPPNMYDVSKDNRSVTEPQHIHSFAGEFEDNFQEYFTKSEKASHIEGTCHEVKILIETVHISLR